MGASLLREFGCLVTPNLARDASFLKYQFPTPASKQQIDGQNPQQIIASQRSHPFVVDTSTGHVGIGTIPKDKLHVKIGTNLNWQFGYPSNSVTTLAALNDAESNYVEARIDALSLQLNSQSAGVVCIGTSTPNANAMLDVFSTTKAFMPPRMTTTQKNAIASPTAGMVVYDSTLAKLCVYTGSAWETITSS